MTSTPNAPGRIGRVQALANRIHRGEHALMRSCPCWLEAEKALADERAAVAEQLIPRGRVYVSGSSERIEFDLIDVRDILGLSDKQIGPLIAASLGGEVPSDT